MGTMAVYEVWETQSGNLVGSYIHERDALLVVRRACDRHGDGSVASLTLARENDQGETEAIASGAGLVELARQAIPTSD
jgi:hypothetical protein